MTTFHAHYSPHKHCSISVHRLRRCAALLWVALPFMLIGCASIKEIQPKEDTMKIYEVAVTRKAVIAGSPDAVFKFITAEDVLPKVLTGYGPLPAVLRTSGNTGPWDRPGSARVVHLADGSTVREQLTGYDSPKRFTYRVWEFGNPIVRTLATQAKGEWDFVATAEGTQVTWTYTFQAKNAAAALPLSGIAQILWRGYMDVCLENTQKIMLAQRAK
jgi:hypothetical protein